MRLAYRASVRLDKEEIGCGFVVCCEAYEDITSHTADGVRLERRLLCFLKALATVTGYRRGTRRRNPDEANVKLSWSSA